MTTVPEPPDAGASVDGESRHVPRRYMDNPPAVAAPKDWVWGYLPCGCRNDGYGRHVRDGWPA